MILMILHKISMLNRHGVDSTAASSKELWTTTPTTFGPATTSVL